jgi:hypothetical protein
MSHWIITYMVMGDGTRKSFSFYPTDGFASARDVVEAIAHNERPEVEFPFGGNSRRTTREVMRTYQIEDTIGHRPDFSIEEAKLSTDAASCNKWRAYRCLTPTRKLS